VAVLLAASQHAGALSVKDLEKEKSLTPKSFAKYFRDFRYEYFPLIRDPELFLFSQTGDCDDYATLADRVLKKAGYRTKLVSVKMPGLPSHVVCYVEEESGYLDYNTRADIFPIKKSGSSLDDIANKVAKSFSANWTSATEFIYEGNNIKKPVYTRAKVDSGKPAKKNAP
jgi:hypothetical protein